MTGQPLTISEVLRFANHDFLNQLQLIKMNLDLGRVEESKKIIEQISEQCKVNSNINKLQLPKTVEWLQTLHWRYPAFQIEVKCNVTAPVEILKDEFIVDYLEKTVIHVNDHLDPYTEQLLTIDIDSSQELFKLIFDLKGKWESELFQNQALGSMKIEIMEQTDISWNYVLTFEQE